MELHLTRHAGPETLLLVPQLKLLYEDAYSEPPYDMSSEDIEQFESRTTQHANQAGFMLVAGEVGSQLAGFTYGFTFPPSRWWTGVKTDPPPDYIAAGSIFAVIELGVRKQSRGHGYARQLVEALLADRPEAFASLISRPGAQAHAMYQRWGWTKVGNTQTYPHWPVEDINILSLHRTAPLGTDATSGTPE
ncbi:GNAT family N-acetyltransferase [Kribbella sp. NPDC058245]|uniref:GNAT family N-acetyltransferase n=1 Tax=Kribbella sp. NPDC058245 TaxID=3346399 RepID=UPI0036E80CFD